MSDERATGAAKFAREMMQEVLVMIVRQIALIPTADLEAHIADAQDSLSMMHSAGPILDPTYYRNSMHDGTFDNAERQLKMAEHLLCVRQLIDEHEAQRLEVLAKEARK